MKTLTHRTSLSGKTQETTKPHNSRSVTIAIVLVATLLAGCTNSKMIISPLYGRLDDQMRKEFHKLGKFNEKQIEQFETRVGTFHVWHRKVELPKYAALINTVQTSIKKRGNTTIDDVQQWIDLAEVHSKKIRTCHPANFSFELMQSLTDKQVNFIQRRFARERKKNYQKTLELTPSEKVRERSKNVTKWARRIGFEFNKEQIKLLNDAFANQGNLTQPYYRLADKWTRDLFAIARRQQAPDYEQHMRLQLNKGWTLVEKAHPDTWRANREVWRDFGFKFVRSMTPEQRTYASNWLRKLAKTITAISKDNPSYTPVNDPQHGCLPVTEP